MDTKSPIDWDEMFELLPGTIVELKENPGTFYEIDCYEAMMVPPVWLLNHPQPHYPHELHIISRQQVQTCALETVVLPR